jgi:hypothetical protein
MRDPLLPIFIELMRGALQDRRSPLDLDDHIVGLCHAWHTTRATPVALRRAATRLPLAHAAMALERAEAEDGHDDLVARDLAALSLMPPDLPDRVRSRHVLALVALHHRLAAEDPYGVFGYAYAMERCASFVDAAAIDRVARLMPPGVDATRCLRTHSGTGVDAHHVVELVSFICDLDAAARRRVVNALQGAAPLMIAVASDPLPRAALRREIASRRAA